MKIADLAIVGGGAAGMYAAVAAAERRMKMILLERKARLGSKVLMTANGRCNFTKDISGEAFLQDVGVCAKFVRPSISACPPRRIISFFKSQNIPVRRMADGRMFPADTKAATILHAFGDFFRYREVPIVSNCAVKSIKKRSGVFAVETENFEVIAKNVLIATGGASYPKTGSVGDGYKFAKAFGHTVTDLRSGLIGLETQDKKVVSLSGRRFEDGRVKVFSPDMKTLFEYRGEIDCEKFGLSGAAIYNSQRFIEHSGIRDYILEVWFAKERLKFRNLKPRPLKESIVTIGGVSLDEVDNVTLESKKVPGLYFAGEVLDIDGPTGGYNLTLAFATANQAVRSMKF